MERAVLTSFARTPFSSQNGKEFQEISLSSLAYAPMVAAMERSRLGKSDVDSVIVGVMSQAGEGGNLARSLALKADERAPFGVIIRVLDALKEAGITGNLPAFTESK